MEITIGNDFELIRKAKSIRYQVFTIDMAYLIPASPTTRSPLENTLRFSMAFNIDGFLAQ